MLKPVCANPAIHLASPQRALRIPDQPRGSSSDEASFSFDKVCLGAAGPFHDSQPQSPATDVSDVPLPLQTSTHSSKPDSSSKLTHNQATGTLTVFDDGPAAMADLAVFRPRADHDHQTAAYGIRSAVSRFEVRLPH